MWKKIKEILCKHNVYKDESTTVSGQSTIATSVINLKILPPTSSQPTETLHHHHRTYRKAATAATGKSTLNKTDEHCRSLFNLLPISLRPRQLHQTSNNKAVDASTTTQISRSIDLSGTDYDSGYMSQTVLTRTPSYTSCYSAIATTVPIPTINRHGSIESLLHGHSKSNPANIRVLIRKNFESFAQAHISVTRGTIATALFSRGPWLYICVESNGQTGYIPRIICSLYKNSMIPDESNYYQNHRQQQLSLSSTDSVSNKDDELDLTVIPKPNDAYFIHSYKQKQKINRYLSHSSNVINDEPKMKEQSKRCCPQVTLIERERRNTCTLPPPVPAPPFINTSKDRRLTINSINWPIATNTCELVGIHQINDSSLSTTNNMTILTQRDTDSSSTQDSGYSESTSYFLVQQTTTPDTEQIPAVINTSKKSNNSSPHYATVRHATRLKIPDATTTHNSTLRRHTEQTPRTTRPLQYRHTLVNGLSVNEMLANNLNKRHSFGAFYISENENYDQSSTKSINTIANNTHIRSNDYAMIRDVRREKSDLYHQMKPCIHNLPDSHQEIPASIFLNHHRQQQKQQQFGSSHSAFRPVQPTMKSKRASSEGHSPSSEHQISSPAISISSSSSLSSSTSSLSNMKKIRLLKQRRLSCDLSTPMVANNMNSINLTRSVCDQISTKKLNDFSRTMSDILCDQFSEINLDAIEKDSLTQPHMNRIEQKTTKNVNIQQNLYTITKDYRSSRASFSVKRGDYVQVIKQVGRACYLVRKQNNGQIGFLPKALMLATTATTKVDTFLEMHGYRETVI